MRNIFVGKHGVCSYCDYNIILFALTVQYRKHTSWRVYEYKHKL